MLLARASVRPRAGRALARPRPRTSGERMNDVTGRRPGPALQVGPTSPADPEPRSRLALWVPALYVAAAGTWIAISDALLAAADLAADERAEISMAKGFGFVAVTALALHLGLRWALRRERRALAERRRAERMYRLLAEHARDVILLVRREDGRILDANAVAERTYGWTREELRAMTVLDLRADGVAAVVSSQMAEADARGIQFETVHRRRDGTLFPVEVSSQGTTLDGRRVLVSVVRDATLRKVAEEALRDREERLALAVEATGLGTFHAVPYGPMEWSPRCREIFGIGESALPDFEAFLRLVHPDDRERTRAAAARWVDPNGDGRYHDQYRCVRPDREIRWVEAHGKTRFERQGDGVRRPVQLVGTIQDITESKAAQARLMQSDRLASVGMLAAGVAHEINNPLSYTAAALDFLHEHADRLTAASSADGAEVLEALAEAREGARRVRHVVRDLSTFSAMREDRRACVELGPIVESAIHMAANEIRHRARLVREYGAAPAVHANEGRLGQVVLNLLVNAAHAIPEGHADANEIRIVTGTDAVGRALLEVRDTGAGIPDEIADRIFDPFFTTKPPGVGTGLGLSICRNIVTGLGGEISAERRAGGGTTMRVALPPAPEAAREASPPVRAVGAPGRRGRVLVVDDEPVVATAIRRVLSPEHEVVTYTHAEDALAAITGGERFDAILCDLMMPNMTGMDLHASLERVAAEQAGRMIVLTGGAFTDRAREFLERVPLPRCEKPFDTQRLREMVRAVVGPG
jgi:PAS domain S-box-containing protein